MKRICHYPGKIITLFVILFPPRSVNSQIPYESKWYKNEQVFKISNYFLFIFKTLIVMLFNEAFLVWTNHFKSWISNVSLGFALANIAHPRLVMEMVRPYLETFIECTIADNQ